jgi:hypothetical protein
LTCRARNSNIPPGHANLQGMTVNQSTIATSKASHTVTIIRRTPRPHSMLTRALHVIAGDLGVTFQIDRISIPSARSRETQFRSSTSANGTRDHSPAPAHGPDHSDQQSHVSGAAKMLQSSALSDPLITRHGYSNLANRQMIPAKSILQMQPPHLQHQPAWTVTLTPESRSPH